MAKTLRSQNKCNDCRYTWYPRGKNLSRVCPSCGSENVATVMNWAPLLAVAAIALYVAFGGKSNNGTPSEASVAQTETLAPTQAADQGAALREPVAAPPSPRPVKREEFIEPARTTRPSEPDVPPLPALAPESSSATTPTAPAPTPTPEVDTFERVYTDEEIAALEDQKRYHGNDPIVRSRLGIPSRETRKLIR